MRLCAMLCLVLAMSGCTSPGAVEEAATSPLREPVSAAFPFAVAGYQDPRITVTNGSYGGAFGVDVGATLIHMEARWSCATPPCSMRLLLIPDGGSTTDSTTGTGSAIHVVETPEPGRWNAQVRPDGFARGEGEIRVTVFYGDVPPGFSAFD